MIEIFMTTQLEEVSRDVSTDVLRVQQDISISFRLKFHCYKFFHNGTSNDKQFIESTKLQESEGN